MEKTNTSNESYIDREVDQILKQELTHFSSKLSKTSLDKTYPSTITSIPNAIRVGTFPTTNIVMSIGWIILHFKGTNLKIFDMRSTESNLADFYVIADVQNHIQAESLSDEIAFQMKRISKKVRGIEGRSGSNWTLIDLDNIIVHIFNENYRSIYDLESLWSSAPRIDIPTDFYFHERESTTTSNLQANRRSSSAEMDLNPSPTNLPRGKSGKGYDWSI